MKETIRNQWYMVKFCMEASPLHFLYHIVICVGLEIFIFLEHTVWIGYNLDAAEQNRDFSRVLVMTVGMVVLLAFHQLCSSIYFYWSTTKIKPLLYQKLQARIYEKAKAVDIACYDDPQYYNEFILSTTQANQCIDRFYDDSYSVIRYVTCLLIDFVYLSVNSWASLIVVLICFLSKFWSSRAYYRLVTNKKLDANISERKRKYQHRVFYLHDYAKELRINKKIGDMLMQDFQDCNEELAQLNRHYGRRLAIYGFIKDYLSGNFIIYAIYLPILIFVYQAYGGVTLSGIVILNNMVRYMSKRGNKLAELAPQLEMNSTFIGKIRSFLGYQVKIKDGEESMQEEFEELTLENVSFAYTQGGREILHDINMQIRKGQKIAIVGYNGAGKSTLVKLLLRLYDPTGGEIRRNGRNIQEFRLKDYQGDFGTVFQDYKMYAATIRENVVMDVCEHSKEETYQVEKALHRARFAVDDYKLKYQIDTPLTTEFEAQGVNLSGGEGQKVAIARSFYRNKAVMIMDEPSSALDPMAEYQLNQAIHQIAEDKTVIFISHRLSTTRDADCIYMMENGRIIEHGTHEELLNSGGKYSKMWNVQAGRYI